MLSSRKDACLVFQFTDVAVGRADLGQLSAVDHAGGRAVMMTDASADGTMTSTAFITPSRSTSVASTEPQAFGLPIAIGIAGVGDDDVPCRNSAAGLDGVAQLVAFTYVGGPCDGLASKFLDRPLRRDAQSTHHIGVRRGRRVECGTKTGT